MSKFVVNLTYSDNDELRQATRPSHREYLRSLLADGKLHEAGPFADDSGAVIVYNAESREEAEAILAADPFSTTHGIVTSAVINEWNKVLPDAN